MTMKAVTLMLALTLALGGTAIRADCAEELKLPAPDKNGGMPLMQALNKRQTNRVASKEALDMQTISDMLWAARGFNRPDKLTIPTAMNHQNVEVYIALDSGIWRYNAQEHTLVKLIDGDQRGPLGGDSAVLLYAAAAEGKEAKWSGMHCGSMYQNVGLYCASAALANVVRGTFSHEFDNALELPLGYQVLVTQGVSKMSK